MYGHVKDALKDVRDTVNEGFNIHRGRGGGGKVEERRRNEKACGHEASHEV